MTNVPPKALRAAFMAVGDAICGPHRLRKRNDIVKVALEAAAPHIAADAIQRDREHSTGGTVWAVQLGTSLTAIFATEDLARQAVKDDPVAYAGQKVSAWMVHGKKARP